MIRRQAGQEYWLIAQDDHARISGDLALRIGNGRFKPPSSASAMLGIGLHDCGWPIHDESPTLNPQHRPLDVFETSPQIGLPIWDASAERATAQDAYAGLLVSLHGMALSVFAVARAPSLGSKWDLSIPRTRFEVNRFQHRMIEMQESLRAKLGMATDRPLKYGLAEETDDPREQKLTFDFRWLQVLDQISLSICCTEPPFGTLSPMHAEIGSPPVTMKVLRKDSDRVLLDPWPFGENEIRVDVPFRRLPAKRYADEAEFRSLYAAASVERFTAVVAGPTI